MFADIVGFTRMTEELSPVETVKILNDVFSIFDDIADKHRVEKIKTIGDAYMACAGLDTGAQIHYADAVASMALEMIQKVDEYRKRTGERLQIRIGIGTGPVVAGVIGKKKFIYDMWGDTVNVAFRLAADAAAEKIVVDLMTHRRLYNRFRFEASQELEVKGKGAWSIPAQRDQAQHHAARPSYRNTPLPAPFHRLPPLPGSPAANLTRSSSFSAASWCAS